jgi:hypothetical protein
MARLDPNFGRNQDGPAGDQNGAAELLALRNG